MPSVLFVCMANQFRSPLAAAYFQNRLNQEGLAEGWTVSSAGTWVKEAVGAHPAAGHIAEKMGLDLSAHITREVTHEMLNDADLVIVMEHGQKEALQFEFADQRKKIIMLTELSGGIAFDIPDPVMDDFTTSGPIAATLFTEIDHGFAEIARRARRARSAEG